VLVNKQVAANLLVVKPRLLWQVQRRRPALGREAPVKLEPMMRDMEEAQAELLRRIAAQDLEALSQFYDQTARPLFSVACRMLGNIADAEEVIQDVFVQIWTKASTFDSEKGRPFHWALALTRNRCIDGLRARRRRARVLVETNGDPEFEPAVEAAPSGVALMENDLAVIQSVVNQLPQEQRRAIELAFFDGLTHQEIAESLHEPLGTIKARIRRGMLSLREGLRTCL
jgi:RNA polymerase sigma-70 factor (ECF subfamily)